MLTAIFMTDKGLPKVFIPIGIFGFLFTVLVIGSLDIFLGIYKEELRISHEKSPVLMEILKRVRKMGEV